MNVNYVPKHSPAPGRWSPSLGRFELPPCPDCRYHHGDDFACVGPDDFVCHRCEQFNCPGCYEDDSKIADREEHETCQKGTEGCCIDHIGPEETECETW